MRMLCRMPKAPRQPRANSLVMLYIIATHYTPHSTLQAYKKLFLGFGAILAISWPIHADDQLLGDALPNRAMRFRRARVMMQWRISRSIARSIAPHRTQKHYSPSPSRHLEKVLAEPSSTLAEPLFGINSGMQRFSA